MYIYSKRGAKNWFRSSFFVDSSYGDPMVRVLFYTIFTSIFIALSLVAMPAGMAESVMMVLRSLALATKEKLRLLNLEESKTAITCAAC